MMSSQTTIMKVEKVVFGAFLELVYGEIPVWLKFYGAKVQQQRHIMLNAEKKVC